MGTPRSECDANQSVKPQRDSATQSVLPQLEVSSFYSLQFFFCCLMKPISFLAQSAGAPLTHALAPVMAHEVSEECVYLLQCLCSGCSTDVSPPPAAQLVRLLFINTSDSQTRIFCPVISKVLQCQPG